MQTHPWVWQIRLGRNLWEKLVKMKNFNATLFSSDIYILFDLSCYRWGLCFPNLTLLTTLTETIWHKMGKERQEEALGGGSSDNKAGLGDFSGDTAPISLFKKCAVCSNAILQPFCCWVEWWHIREDVARPVCRTVSSSQKVICWRRAALDCFNLRQAGLQPHLDCWKSQCSEIKYKRAAADTGGAQLSHLQVQKKCNHRHQQLFTYLHNRHDQCGRSMHRHRN